eukprot:SAG31_NODE_5747_length_2347_cov_1.929270_3_plen_93_part_00
MRELAALGTLASELGRTEDAQLLTQRRQSLGALIKTHMWQPHASTYSNLLLNGSAYLRISPTSFYPLLAGLASDTQAIASVLQSLNICSPSL